MPYICKTRMCGISARQEAIRQGGYVYRLIQAEVDKLIEIEEPSEELATPMTQEEQLDGKFALLSAPQQLSKKMRALEAEYNGVLASQLDQQRFYFQEQLKGVKKEVESKKEEIKKEIIERSKEAEKREERVLKLEEELEVWEKKLKNQENIEIRLKEKQKQLIQEKQRLFKVLEERKDSKKREMEKLEEQIESAEEVLKDLKTHIAAQQSFKGQQADEGQIFVLGKPSIGKKKKSKK